MRQLTEKHTSDPLCAGCHARIDGYGFALEGYDAIGRARTRDLADRPIDTRGKLFDGTQVEGADALRDYLLTKKRDVVPAPILSQAARLRAGPRRATVGQTAVDRDATAVARARLPFQRRRGNHRPEQTVPRNSRGAEGGGLGREGRGAAGEGFGGGVPGDGRVFVGANI